MDQLLYGSADGIKGRQRGGWGVIQETPPLTPERREQLAVLASVYLKQTMPQFPSASDLARRVRRFRSGPAGDETIVCMSAEAGPDHTGRPGNVISHCAAVPVSTGLRPIDWFFSDGWVLPFGAHRVADAALVADLPRPGGWAGTAGWLRADPQRIVRAKSIVSKGVSVLQHAKRPLVVVAPTPEEGARWLSAILWMLSPADAGKYHLRVGEDARSMREAAKDPYIAVLGPEVTIPEKFEPGVVDTSVDDGADGDWGQVLADLLMQPPSVAEAVFEHRDELLRRYADEGLTEPFKMVQALKTAWLSRDGGQNFGQEKAIAELVEAVGPRVRQWPELQALATSVGKADEDAYGLVEESYSPDEAYEGVDDTYLTAPTIGRGQAAVPVAAGLADRALGAAARLGSATLDESAWTGTEDAAAVADRLLVAAASSDVAPPFEQLAGAVAVLDVADPELVQAATIVVARSEEAHGVAERWAEEPWRRLSEAIASLGAADWLQPWAGRGSAAPGSVWGLKVADGRTLQEMLGGDPWQ